MAEPPAAVICYLELADYSSPPPPSIVSRFRMPSCRKTRLARRRARCLRLSAMRMPASLQAAKRSQSGGLTVDMDSDPERDGEATEEATGDV